MLAKKQRWALNLWTVPQEWQGETAFIIAGGPSVTQEQVDRLKGRKVIAIKLSCEKAPWADFLFFADGTWYKDHKQIARGFAGRVVTTAALPEAPPKVLLLRKAPKEKNEPVFLQTDRQALTVRRTSVTGAINLAVHLGATKIAVLGLDGKVGAGGRTHHHTPHALPRQHGFFDEQRKDLEAIGPGLKAAGVEVFNTNPASAFRMFAFADLETFLNDTDNLDRLGSAGGRGLCGGAGECAPPPDATNSDPGVDPRQSAGGGTL